MLACNVLLAYEEHLAVLRQCPELIAHDEFELVYLVAYLLHLGSHRVVIGHGLGALIGYLVGHLAGVNQFLDTRLYYLGALSYLLDNFLVAPFRPFVFCLFLLYQ